MRLPTVLCTGFLLLLTACGGERPGARLRLSTGAEGGVNAVLGEALAAVLRRELGAEVEILRSEGSVQNMRRVELKEADLAFVQSDTVGSAEVRSVALLYREVMHVFVRPSLLDRELSALANPWEVLRGQPVAIGRSGSGTAEVASFLLDHYALEGERRYLDLETARAQLARGEIAALFLLAAAPCPAGKEMLSAGEARLLPWGDPERVGSALEGIEAAHPFLKSGVIPARTYGTAPAKPVGTIGVHALLVTHRDLDQELGRRVSKALFENKVALTERHAVAAQMRELHGDVPVRFPPHAGAVDWMNREEPSFFVRYAEAMSFGLTLLLLLGSTLLGLKAWFTKRRKNRIDGYYLDVEALSSELARLDVEGLEDRQRQLHALRRRAFKDLVDERLEANESFTIFQDYLIAELQAIEGWLGRKRRGRAE